MVRVSLAERYTIIGSRDKELEANDKK